MTDEVLPVVTATRRRGDVVAPTISDVACDEIGFVSVLLERPRKPALPDYAADGKPHPCIPAGEYRVIPTHGVYPKHPDCFQVVTGRGTPAPDRSDILMHAANWIRELLGCLAFGKTAEIVEGEYEGQHVRELGVSLSGPALADFIAKMGWRPFKLVLKDLNDEP